MEMPKVAHANSQGPVLFRMPGIIPRNVLQSLRQRFPFRKDQRGLSIIVPLGCLYSWATHSLHTESPLLQLIIYIAIFAIKSWKYLEADLLRISPTSKISSAYRNIKWLPPCAVCTSLTAVGTSGSCPRPHHSSPCLAEQREQNFILCRIWGYA